MKQSASTNKKTILPTESAAKKSVLDKSTKDGKSALQNKIVDEAVVEIPPPEKIGKLI
jgi:hypothetical protein